MMKEGHKVQAKKRGKWPVKEESGKKEYCYIYFFEYCSMPECFPLNAAVLPVHNREILYF